MEASISKLLGISALAGLLAGFLELYAGHRFILDPLLYGKDSGFVYESFFAPTYYGLIKSIVVAIVFLFAYLAGKKIKYKSAFIGIAATFLFGVYYYILFPRVAISSALIITIVHFSFITAASYALAKISKLQ